MAAEDFFRRWARPGQPQPSEPPTSSASSEPAAAAATPPALPGMEQVAQLHADADFSVFMAPGVEPAVHRAAMKKLFSQPQFNVMDGLDTYIDDYGQPDPLPPGMLEALRHAEHLLDPLKQLEYPWSDLPALQQAQPAPETSAAASTQDDLPEAGESEDEPT